MKVLEGDCRHHARMKSNLAAIIWIANILKAKSLIFEALTIVTRLIVTLLQVINTRARCLGSAVGNGKYHEQELLLCISKIEARESCKEVMKYIGVTALSSLCPHIIQWTCGRPLDLWILDHPVRGTKRKLTSDTNCIIMCPGEYPIGHHKSN
jgi:hypothetical protein